VYRRDARVIPNFYHDLIDRFGMSGALVVAFLFDSRRGGTIVTEREGGGGRDRGSSPPPTPTPTPAPANGIADGIYVYANLQLAYVARSYLPALMRARVRANSIGGPAEEPVPAYRNRAGERFIFPLSAICKQPATHRPFDLAGERGGVTSSTPTERISRAEFPSRKTTSAR